MAARRSAALVLALSLCAAAGERPAVHPLLPAADVEAARRQEPQRAKAALEFLAARDLGLGDGDSFFQESVNTNRQGQTVVRYHQLHAGFRVFGSSVTVRIDPDGAATLLARDVAPGIALPPDVVLSADDALLAAHRNIAPAGAYESVPTPERVVFPTAFAQGFKLTKDATGRPLIDRDGSLLGVRPAGQHAWAWLVSANLNNAQDGYRELRLVVDASSGQVLRKWDAAAALTGRPPPAGKPLDYAAMARAAASRPQVAPRSYRPRSAGARAAAPMAAPIAAKGWGHDQYVGLVFLDTVESPLGTGYDLTDITRAAQPHPRFQTSGIQTWYWDPMAALGGTPGAGDYEFPYISYEFFNTFSMDNLGWGPSGAGAGSASNVWGDGEAYLSPFNLVDGRPTRTPKSISEFHYGDANGQTAAVGAHWGAAETYDFYKNVLGRLGIDGKDSGMIQVVHDDLGSFDNAHFSNGDLMMHYGDGDWSKAFGGQFTSFTQITISGHEMSHGEMAFTANVDYWGEGMGLNEGNSDVMGMGVEAYSRRGPQDALDRIPEGKASWVLAPEISVSHKPLRWYFKPSKDGMSPDAWYQGINNIDGHYSMGVVIRFFYFLAMGASGDPAAETYSPYLPQGMTGIGIDAASRVWFKAVAEYMTPSTTLRGMRPALLSAVSDLYGTDSPQGQAVANALSAVNVGAAYDAPARPVVTFPTDLVDPGSPLGNIGLATESYGWLVQHIYYTVPMVPMGETARITALVAGGKSSQVTWSTGWTNLYVPFPNDGLDGATPAGPAAANGAFDPDGLYHAPLVGPKFNMVKATAKDDPLAFGYLPTMVANLDSDGDGESDAVDMGAFALCYGLPVSISDTVNFGGFPAGALYYDGGTGYIGFGFDDYSLQVFLEAFGNAFGR